MLHPILSGKIEFLRDFLAPTHSSHTRAILAGVKLCMISVPTTTLSGLRGELIFTTCFRKKTNFFTMLQPRPVSLFFDLFGVEICAIYVPTTTVPVSKRELIFTTYLREKQIFLSIRALTSWSLFNLFSIRCLITVSNYAQYPLYQYIPYEKPSFNASLFFKKQFFSPFFSSGRMAVFRTKFFSASKYAQYTYIQQFEFRREN